MTQEQLFRKCPHKNDTFSTLDSTVDIRIVYNDTITNDLVDFSRLEYNYEMDDIAEMNEKIESLGWNSTFYNQTMCQLWFHYNAQQSTNASRY